MTTLEMYNDLSTKFPDIAKKASAIHVQAWGSLEPKFLFSWFESLAKALNQEIIHEVDASRYADLFEYLQKQYLFGDAEVKKCIDASFIENLFWHVDTEKAESYWSLLPDVLKDLYINFHHRSPA